MAQNDAFKAQVMSHRMVWAKAFKKTSTNGLKAKLDALPIKDMF